MTAYFDDGQVQLYLGDFREVLPDIMRESLADLVVADPPYGETSLPWDRWPDAWPEQAALYADSMWCFGSMRMFLDRWPEFGVWKMSQDIVWEKHNGSGFHADRFRRVHEHALHFYRGAWSDVYHEVPTTSDAVARSVKSKRRPAHMGQIERTAYTSIDGGPRLKPSVMYAPSAHGTAINETQKPVSVVEDLLRYACPPDGGRVIDIFAGSCTTLIAARHLGVRAIGVELREEQCERAALRLSQGVLV